MNLATIKAIRQGIAEIAQQAETGWSGDDYNAGAADVHRRVDNYLCELIAENCGEVKEPEVFRYIEVRQRGAGVLYREPAQEPGSMAIWDVRIKHLEQEFTGDEIFVDLYEYDTEQILSTVQETELKIPWSDFPNWVHFVCMNEQGDWTLHELEPFLHETHWSASGAVWAFATRYKMPEYYATDWRTSLRQRPAKTTEQ